MAREQPVELPHIKWLPPSGPDIDVQMTLRWLGLTAMEAGEVTRLADVAGKRPQDVAAGAIREWLARPSPEVLTR